ncbi:hypothetical protein [Nonomuraea sp. CA-141351]|uniref:hypothetical protein n=1 Tax=Nonomuraea sp. CA-141351 TaxID=3239996 RepID=UPI003D90B09A
MTPAELWAALNARRRECGLLLWQVALQLDVGEDAVHRLRSGSAGPEMRRRVMAWLEAREARPPPDSA